MVIWTKYLHCTHTHCVYCYFKGQLLCCFLLYGFFFLFWLIVFLYIIFLFDRRCFSITGCKFKIGFVNPVRCICVWKWCINLNWSTLHRIIYNLNKNGQTQRNNACGSKCMCVKQAHGILIASFCVCLSLHESHFHASLINEHILVGSFFF